MNSSSSVGALNSFGGLGFGASASLPSPPSSVDGLSASSSSPPCVNGRDRNGGDGGEIEDVDDKDYDELCTRLCELFPSACSLEVHHCASIAQGNIEAAAQLMIQRQETGDAITEQEQKTNVSQHQVHFVSYKTKIMFLLVF